MSYLRCDCISSVGMSGPAMENFYAKHFIPRKWEMFYFGPVTGGPTLLLKGDCQVCHRDLAVQLPIPKCGSAEDAFQCIYDTICTAHPYDRRLDPSACQGAGINPYRGDCEERSAFYERRDKLPLFRRNTQFLDLFSEYDREDARLWLEKKYPPQTYTEVYRDTDGSLFCTAVRMAKKNGDFDRAAEIIDYVLPSEKEGHTREPVKLTDYEFDFFAIANFGGSEGIYLDCYLRGKFDESGRYQVNVGTIKTLRDDLEALKIMGELGGALTFHASKYVNEHLHRYTPDRELEADAKRQSES